MRGKETAGVSAEDDVGITPAHAGKSFIVGDSSAEDGDHPRACGEKLT